MAPTPEQIPGSQAQMFGNQQPEAQEATRDFERQALADLAFQTQRLDFFDDRSLAAVLGGQADRGLPRIQGVEFFFAGRSRR